MISLKSKSISVLLCLLLLSSISQGQEKDYPIRPVPFTAVQVNDNFWAPRIRLNHDVTIPIALAQCYTTGRVDNFIIAGKLKSGKFCTEYPFDDTDIYKILEGASYSIQTFPDKNLEARMDTLIYYIGKAQEPDGYLYTNRTIDSTHLHAWAGKKRWEKDPELSHELYNCGHLYEAAVAHYMATGKRSLLDIAVKNADLLVKDFGPGKLAYEPGHQIVEMGLVKMYRVTGKKEYLDLAKYFLDIRGKGSEYSQDQKKVTEQTEAVGHAVRAMYMYSGMADVAAITGDQAYLHAIDLIWKDIMDYKFYITGGIGAAGGHEGFGPRYDLPNMSAYNETCASIGEVYWNHRLFLLHGNSQYYDVLERVLYNGLISGVSLSGDHFFYPNPLESVGQHARSAWFGCACCPSNICRFIPSVPGYIYAQNKDRLYANLFIGSNASIDFNGSKLGITQKTDYPWSGNVEFQLNPEKEKVFEFAIRIPGWARNEPVPGDLYSFESADSSSVKILVNGKLYSYTLSNGYAVIKNRWKKGDKVTVSLPMPVRYVVANKKVEADNHKIALQRGPLVYCVEWPDNKDGHVLNLLLDNRSGLKTQFTPEILKGVTVISGDAKGVKRKLDGTTEVSKETLTAIPYYAWANRGSGEMAVWLATQQGAARPLPAPTLASTGKISASLKTKALMSINDQMVPKSSNDQSVPYYHWWPKKDTVQWIQCDFAKPAHISKASVYWFDDAPWGGCRVPEYWKIQYLDTNGSWTDVSNPSVYGVEKDKTNLVHFGAVETSALRLVVKLPANHSSGLYEWSFE
ncbi:MAG TPA: beta-L-arabinofuranosidase domain-containing protein [Bacteroidales bacterium]|nr:beta-L-arabinofuranosidase domain-containing protein [Bacteroidales bacterium]